MATVARIAQGLAPLGERWFEWKQGLEHSVAIHEDALHVIVGVVLQLVLSGLARVPVSHPAVWLIVLAMELANEWADVVFGQPVGSWGEGRVGEAVKDVALTMLLPTLLLIVSRWRPGLLARR